MADDDEKCAMCGQVRQEGYICNRGVCGFARVVKMDGHEDIEIPANTHRLRLVVNGNG